MGLFDELAGQVKGALGGAAGEHGDAIAHMMQSLNSGGGLNGLLQQFQNNGLGHLVQSWIGTGQNLPVSADQIQKVLGDTHVRDLAAKLGIDPQQAAAKLSAFLPALVDKMTPAGKLPGA
ncbi:MAG TPA: YidB family protein [Gemmatimonadales bacterium]|nr:YidB family protein [Gemmatimonadales bacterium]